MRKYPLVPVALAIIIGILLAHHIFFLTMQFWLYALLACAIAFGIVFLVCPPQKENIKNKKIMACATVFCCLLGGLLGSTGEHGVWVHMCPEKTFMAVRLTETPTPRAKSYKAQAEVLAVDGIPSHGAIRLYLRSDSAAATLRYGDRLLLHGYPDTLKASMYITSDHYILTARDSTSLRARSERLRMRLLGRMQSGPLDARYAGVAEALTLGWRADIDPATQASYRDAGIAHLLAVSGLHVGLVAAMVGMMLFWVGRERRGRIVRGSIQLAAVWLFALTTGMAPSTVRAALMFSLFIVSDIVGRRTPKLNLLAAAAIIMLVVNPMLLFDVGWQLSFSAVAGILLAMPVITAFRNKLYQAAMVSVVATTATLPVTLVTFLRFQPYFLVANVLIVPLSAFILGFSLLYMAIPCCTTAWPVEMLLRATEAVTSWVASLPGAVIYL